MFIVRSTMYGGWSWLDQPILKQLMIYQDGLANRLVLHNGPLGKTLFGVYTISLPNMVLKPPVLSVYHFTESPFELDAKHPGVSTLSHSWLNLHKEHGKYVLQLLIITTLANQSCTPLTVKTRLHLFGATILFLRKQH